MMLQDDFPFGENTGAAGRGERSTKLTKMKKQFLLLAFFTLAVFASTTVYGQMRPSNIAPTPLTNCTPSPLNPMAGLPFTYTVTNPNAVANNATYTWWATKNPNFINTTSFLSDTVSMLYANPPKDVTNELLATGANYGVLLGAGPSMAITWSPYILAATDYQGTPDINGTPAAPSPTFVVVQADGTCNNNIQVFEIDPLASFTLDIANINPADTAQTLAYGTDAEQCVDIVRSATYSGGQVLMDYGTDTLLFEVIATNYVTNWIPTFEIMSGLTANQTATILWSYTKPGALTGTGAIETEATIAVGTPLVGSTALVPGAGVSISDGTSIYVRVIIDNNQFESIADQPFVLAVDGVDATNQADIAQTATDCTATPDDREDQATHNITPRPDIVDATGDGAINPQAPDTFIPSPRP
jgi:hypothetical protein